MTILRVDKLMIPSVQFHGVSSLPSISENLRLSFMEDVFELDEDDGLFVNYGMVDYGFPYKAQDNYDRKLKDTEQVVVVLENKYLKATFFPQFGGKLHSLYDKEKDRELLFSNSVVRPCHLGVRNAWMSGGVEWNCGYVGHNPFTCDWMHTARTKLEDGTPVLRFYQYERIRGVVYQMDFFLPDESRFLYARTKIVNPQFRVVPMYWWSNIAAPDKKGSRVVVPVTDTYTASWDHHPIKIKVPVYNGIDITYPLENVLSIDYFWNIPKEERKFICLLDENGYGLAQTSTRRLQGRKLFVWGNSQGGERWKKFLTADEEDGSYNEIQAGIAKTQYECLPMPPKTVWEWIEAYGAIQTNPNKTHGSWEEAKIEARDCLEKLVTEEKLENLLKDTKKMAKTQAEEMLFYADGWGALEQERRCICGEDEMCAYLDFGPLTEEQQSWLLLLKNGTIGKHDPVNPPISYMCQQEWTKLLQEAVKNKDKDNWFAWLQLGLNTFVEKDFERAEQMLLASLDKMRSPWALYALAILNRDLNNHEKEVSYMLEAYYLIPDDVSMAKATLRCMYENRKFTKLKKIYENMPREIRAIPRCKVYYAFSLVESGDIVGAEEIIYEDNGLLIPDLRECETITLDLWYRIEEKKAEKAGKHFGKDDVTPPDFTDFRMFANIEWLKGESSPCQ